MYSTVGYRILLTFVKSHLVEEHFHLRCSQALVKQAEKSRNKPLLVDALHGLDGNLRFDRLRLPLLHRLVLE